MNTFLEARYHESHRRYLNQVAYMNESNLAFAEKKGGPDRLEGTDKARFEGIQTRLIDLVAFADAAGEYIGSLEDYIEELIQEKKSLKARLTEATGERPLPPPIPYRSYLQMMILCSDIPAPIGALIDSREGRRQAGINALRIEMPNMF